MVPNTDRAGHERTTRATKREGKPRRLSPVPILVVLLAFLLGAAGSAQAIHAGGNTLGELVGDATGAAQDQVSATENLVERVSSDPADPDPAIEDYRADTERFGHRVLTLPRTLFGGLGDIVAETFHALGALGEEIGGPAGSAVANITGFLGETAVGAFETARDTAAEVRDTTMDTVHWVLDLIR